MIGKFSGYVHFFQLAGVLAIQLELREQLLVHPNIAMPLFSLHGCLATSKNNVGT